MKTVITRITCKNDTNGNPGAARSNMKTVKELAKEVLDQFEHIKPRDKEIWHLKDGSPEWMTERVHEAHGDFFPDDYKYQFVVDALDALQEQDDIDDAWESIESDIYTHDLLTWLSSNLLRTDYCDQAAEELGVKDAATLVERITLGQWFERKEVFDIVAQFLQNKAEE